MNKSTNWGLYSGILLVLIGMMFFLDLNGILPDQYVSEYLNLIIGAVFMVAYIRQRRLSALMVGTLFLTNGLLLLLDNYVPDFIYLTGILIIPGVMFLVAYVARKNIAFLVPGAMMTSWGIYLILIITDVLNHFTMIVGMGFIFTAIGFLIIFICEMQIWSGIPAAVIGAVGIIIVALGLGPAARHIMFNLATIGVILTGIGLIVRSLLKNNDHK